MFEKFDADVTIKSITFKSEIEYDPCISSAQVELSNGEKSPVFEKQGQQYYHE